MCVERPPGNSGNSCLVAHQCEPTLGLKSPIQIMGCLVRGFCTKCGREVGGWFKAPAWQCPRCRGLYCERCPKRTVGRWFKKPVCPECRIELAEVSHVPRIEYQNRF